MTFTVPEVLPLVLDLYKTNCVGCCLHIVLDDGNIRDSDIRFCAEQAIQEKHQGCLNLAYILSNMSKTQRNKLSGNNERYKINE